MAALYDLGFLLGSLAEAAWDLASGVSGRDQKRVR
jgi:hypothetical protein